MNLSDDTITVTASSESDDNLKIVVPPHSEGVLTSNGLSDVQASTSGGASKVTFLFHIFFSRDPGSDKNHKRYSYALYLFPVFYSLDLISSIL